MFEQNHHLSQTESQRVGGDLYRLDAIYGFWLVPLVRGVRLQDVSGFIERRFCILELVPY